MPITNTESGTNVHEVSDGIYRINTPVVMKGGGGFSFNQYLIDDDHPLLFHTGPRKMFPLVHEAVKSILPVKRLRYIAFSHLESDECGSLNEWLSAATQAIPLCGTIAAMVSIEDLADRTPRAMADGESISLGKHCVRWINAPHTPHAWECGFLTEELTRTLLCGDLFSACTKSHFFKNALLNLMNYFLNFDSASLKTHQLLRVLLAEVSQLLSS